jgi:hypothetical protein
MSSELDRAATALFPEVGPAAIGNVKFMGGTRRIVTAEELAEQLMRANAQIREGVAVRIADLDAGFCC